MLEHDGSAEGMDWDKSSVGRLFGKWTGLAFIRKKYRVWRAKLAVKDQSTTKPSKFGSKDSVHPPFMECHQTVHSNKQQFDGKFAPSFISKLSTDDGPIFEKYETFLEHRANSFEAPLHSSEVFRERLSDLSVAWRILSAGDENIDPSNRVIPRALAEASSIRFVFQKLLGTGSFSKVKLAVDRHSGDFVAVKMIDTREIQSTPRLQQTLVREIEILKRVNHRNIVRFREATLIKDKICLVMDYVPGCELFQYVADQKKLKEQEASMLLRQLLEAVQYLHQNGIAHRDLKLENILVDTKLGGAKLTLVDFGLASVIMPEAPFKTRCGSEEYAAPEVIIGDPYDGQHSDAWSFGVVMYACLTGSLPFNPDPARPRALAEKIVSASYRCPDDLMSLQAAHIIKGLLVREPACRTTISELLANPWFLTSP